MFTFSAKNEFFSLQDCIRFFVLITFTYPLKLYFISQPFIYSEKQASLLHRPPWCRQTAMLSWDRLDLDQVCWKILDVMPSFGNSQLFQRVTLPESNPGKGQSSSFCWGLGRCYMQVKSPVGEAEISAKISAAFAHKRLLRSLPKHSQGSKAPKHCIEGLQASQPWSWEQKPRFTASCMLLQYYIPLSTSL